MSQSTQCLGSVVIFVAHYWYITRRWNGHSKVWDLERQEMLKDVDNIEAKGALNKNGRLKEGGRETGN